MSGSANNSDEIECANSSSPDDRGHPRNPMIGTRTDTDERIDLFDDKGDEDTDQDFEADEWNPSDDEFEKSAILERQKFIKSTDAVTLLEKALKAELDRKDVLITRLTSELLRLKRFVSKRKQVYKRKRKAEGAPTRALSAYNIFVQERFSQLAKENEAALKSDGVDTELKRVPPATLVAATGIEWKELSSEEKAQYQERALEDRKRYREQMTQYRAPDKQTGKKRLKTGYNMFFSAHAQQLKQNENGIPSERGSIARIVGNAWKELPYETKQLYEQEAERYNSASVEEADDSEKQLCRKTAISAPVKATSPGDMPPSDMLILPRPIGAPVVHQPGHHDTRIHSAMPYPYPFYEYPLTAEGTVGKPLPQHSYPPPPYIPVPYPHVYDRPCA